MQEPTQPPRALARVGMPGAGKTLCAQHLQARGFAQFRFGSIIVNEVTRRGWPITPENERLVREEFRASGGMDAIARRALVIDGLYGFSEYKTLRVELDAAMVVVAVVSQRGLRYARLAARPERPLTPEEAQRRDYQEIETLEKGGPIAIADYTLLNDTTPTDLLAALDALMAAIGFHP